MGEIGSGNNSSYPGTLDTNTIPEVNSPAAGKTKARKEPIEDLTDAVIKIETALGTNPAGSLTDVKTFLQTQHQTDGTHKNTHGPHKWIDEQDYANFSAAVAAAANKTLVIARSINLDANTTIPASVSIMPINPGIINANGYTLTINGPVVGNPMHQWLSGFTGGNGQDVFDLLFSVGSIKAIFSEWFGAKGNNLTDCTSALNIATLVASCSNYAISASGYIPDYNFETQLVNGIYKVTSTSGNFAVTALCGISGISPKSSHIYNIGTGSALRIKSGYYSRFKDFSVIGNPSSEDGIVESISTSDATIPYSHFAHVDSIYHGRHGLIHRNSWATKYIDCKFHYNLGLGIYLNTQSGDSGTANGVSFINCESRYNGGTLTTTTANDDKGGVKIEGGAVVSFVGGIYEYNNAWDFIIAKSNNFVTRIINFDGIYCEVSDKATVGGLFYIGDGVTTGIKISHSWLGYGAPANKTRYCFYNEDNANPIMLGDQVFTVGGGAGTEILAYNNILNSYYYKRTTIMMGDVAQQNQASTTTFLTVTNVGEYLISGLIHCRKRDSVGGIYPFIAGKDSTGTRTATVGSAIVGSVTTPPTLAWSGDDLQLTFAAYHWGYMEITGGEMDLGGKIGVYNNPAKITWNEIKYYREARYPIT